MATLVLTTVGTALGGPLGGALGTLAGRALDNAIFGAPKHEGARLKELSVTTSSYGSAIPRHFGTVRAAGSIIWATDLIEHKEKSGGGKGKPKVATYSYTTSFAVALASRPIQSVGRIWADGNLLRGAGGDLKTGGEMRVYRGSERQAPDGLIASDIGAGCPAFRGIAYVVFEDLQLADFGNRIPALTFEIVADDGALDLVTMIGEDPNLQSSVHLEGLAGISHDGGSELSLLATLHAGYPLSIDATRGRLSVHAAVNEPDATVIDLPPPIADSQGDFGQATGASRSRKAGIQRNALCLRYYDRERDFQPGLQRSRGMAGNGAMETVDFPAGLTADAARRIAEEMAERNLSGREKVAYRVGTLDPAIRPGSYVRPQGETGIWQVAGWEWRAAGVELDLRSVQLRSGNGLRSAGDAGADRKPRDLSNGPTLLSAFELPWDGAGRVNERKIYAAVSSAHEGWAGAALHLDAGDGVLVPAGVAGKTRAVVGTVQSAIPPSTPHLFDRSAPIMVLLADEAFALSDASVEEMAQGRNQARIGNEIIQFGSAVHRGGGLWELTNLLRGRGGTEHAIGSHIPGEDFIFLDDELTLIDSSAISSLADVDVVALGQADPQPVRSTISDSGLTLRPLTPVRAHFVETDTGDGSSKLLWTRRSRGAWAWPDEVEIPLSETFERYEVRFIDAAQDVLAWEVSQPHLELDATTMGQLDIRPKPAKFQIRQVGDYGRSLPLEVSF